MLKLSTKLLLLTLVSMMLFSGCTKSEKATIQDTKDKVQSIFNEKKILPNEKLADFSFYLPQNLKLIEKGKNNVLIKYGNQLFILFVNPHENSQSELNYKDEMQNQDQNSILQKINVKDSFTYVFLKKGKKDKKTYQLIVSSGGNKMTTVTTINNMVQSAELMSKMIHSVKVDIKS